MSERDTVYFQLRVPREMHEQFKAISDSLEDRSVHWVYLRALREWLACQPPPTP